jgi:hypothetical protein
MRPPAARNLTRLIADTDCASCGGLLVPPEVASSAWIPEGVDYICLTCGLPHAWVGNPPRLAQMMPRDTDDDEYDE